MPYTSLAAILDTIDTLTRAELEQVQTRLDSVLANLDEQVESEDVGLPVAPRIIVEMVSCGKANCKRCAGGKKGHGPYKYEVWYSSKKGRDVKKYLGKV